MGFVIGNSVEYRNFDDYMKELTWMGQNVTDKNGTVFYEKNSYGTISSPK